MRLWVLGSGTALPDAERGPTALAVASEGDVWLIDGGSGTIDRCVRAGIDPLTLTGGLFTHRHLDHCADLAPLLFAFRVARRQAPYPIVAGQGFAAYLDGLRALYGSWLSFPGSATVDEVPLDRSAERRLGALTVRTAPANHNAGAVHVRLEADGAAVVFSGDTGPSEPLVELCRGADLLVCECGSSANTPLAGHMLPGDVRDLVAQARPGEVWLTHFYPGSDPDSAVRTIATTGVPTRRAHDGDVWTSPST